MPDHLSRGEGRLASQAQQPLAKLSPTSQGAMEKVEPPSSLSQLHACRRPLGWGRGACVPYSDRPPQRSPCCLARHSAQSPGLEAQSGCWQGRREWDRASLARLVAEWDGSPRIMGLGQGSKNGAPVGSPGRCQGMVAVILTGGSALPAGLDGIALIS